MSDLYDNLWKEIDALVEKQLAKKQSHERSVDELSKLWGMGNARAEKLAEKLIAEGKMIKRQAMSFNGRVIWVYSPTVKIGASSE